MDDGYRDAGRPAAWDGLYIGAHLGGGWGSVAPRHLSSDGVELSGFQLGAHVGYDITVGNILLGLEADGTSSWSDGAAIYAGPVAVDSRLDWLSTMRGRLGYVNGPWLMYLTGGAALAGLDTTVTSGGVRWSSSDMLLGYAVGGGIAYRMTREMSLRVEAVHHGFAEETVRTSAGTLKLDADLTTVRAGLTYHFN